MSNESRLPAAAIHRIGKLTVGDLALVATGAPLHRVEAFATCAQSVERIKAEVSIWKGQHIADASPEWVGL